MEIFLPRKMPTMPLTWKSFEIPSLKVEDNVPQRAPGNNLTIPIDPVSKIFGKDVATSNFSASNCPQMTGGDLILRVLEEQRIHFCGSISMVPLLLTYLVPEL